MDLVRRALGIGRAAGDDDRSVEGGGEPGDPAERRHAVTVWLRLLDPAFENEREQQRVFALEDRVMAALDASGAGTFDTNELTRGSFGMRLLGADADAMLAVVQPLLDDSPAGSYLSVRRGPEGTTEERLEIERR